MQQVPFPFNSEMAADDKLTPLDAPPSKAMAIIVRNDFLVPPFYKKFPLSGRFPLSKTCPGSGNCDMSDRSRRAGMVHQGLLENQLGQ